MVILLLLACAPKDDSKPLDADEETAGADDSGHADDSGDTDTFPDTGPFDADGDGVSPGEGDCDDTDARVYPGAPDACDALDQDCDGVAQRRWCSRPARHLLLRVV